MNIDAPIIGIAILRIESLEPENTCHNRITPRRVRFNNFTGRATRMEYRAKRRTLTDLGAYAEMAEWCGKTARSIPRAILRGGNWIECYRLSIGKHQHLLLGYAHYYPVVGVGTSG
jgi:hypothetical protein